MVATTDRLDWLRARQRTLGGSDVAAILGLSRYRTGFDVWCDKTRNLEEEPQDDKPWFLRGRVLEPAVGQWYAQEQGLQLHQNAPYSVEAGPESWMAASVDFKLKDESGAIVRGLECKTSRHHKGWGESGTDAVPVDYQIQCAWYRIVTGLKRWDVAVFLTLQDEFRWYKLEQDEEVETVIVDRARAWWQKHIVGGVAPDIDGSDGASEWLRRRFPAAVEPLRTASDAERSTAERLHVIKRQISDLEKQEKELQNQLVHRIGTSEGFEWEGGKVTYKEQSRRSLDGKALKEAHPDIAAQFEKTSQFRVLRIQKHTDNEE